MVDQLIAALVPQDPTDVAEPLFSAVSLQQQVVREIAKHTPELAQLVVGNGGVGALVDYVSESAGNNRLPGIMALGYIAAFRYASACMLLSARLLELLPAALRPAPARIILILHLRAC